MDTPAAGDFADMVTISRSSVNRPTPHEQPEAVRQLRVVYMKPPRQTVSGPDKSTPGAAAADSSPPGKAGSGRTRNGVRLGSAGDGAGGAGGAGGGAGAAAGPIGRAIGAPGPGSAGPDLGGR
ncbi:hypothetical protein COO60DRAFT_1645174 [Scenedesmus sp. NREL 46B-D3]|nr:hypothetical protein COO60DRAFT_1645174 [Scenedesmus sp. NREL 46B-D3]